MESVSRQHAKVRYDKDFGWLIKEFSDDKKSTSGTWIHPKTYNLARYSTGHSDPIKMYDGFKVRSHEFLLQFDFV